jgi:arylsulfatase A-like enzyme
LHKLVDQAIGRILESLDDAGLADDTIVVFTSDHGDLLGAHGGMVQKWHNAFDEAIRVPFLVNGPGVAAADQGTNMPTSHVDVIPTLLGLAGIDVDRAFAGVAEHHDEAQPLPGRDLSGLVTGSTTASNSLASPIYFMTEDDITRGATQNNVLTGKPFEAVDAPSHVESVIATLATGPDGVEELWKLNHYYERLDDWNEAHGFPKNPFLGPAAAAVFELHNLTADPEERHNRASDAPEALSRLQTILDQQRDAKRLVPVHRNPGS